MNANGRADRVSRSHLLVVDDDWETRELLSSYLGKQGFEVSTVADGPAMDAWLEMHSADLVILDLMLPGEDGLSIARRLGNKHKMPIVMISARGEELDRTHARVKRRRRERETERERERERQRDTDRHRQRATEREPDGSVVRAWRA